MNSEKILSNILNLNCEITNNFFKKTQFTNSIYEEHFQEESYLSSKNRDLISNLLILLGYIATLIYIFVAFLQTIYIIVCAICFISALFSLILSLHFKTRKFQFYNDHIQIFLSSFNLISKGFILCFHINDKNNDHPEEMLRIIIYDFISVNLYIITKLEANIFVNLFYLFLNLTLVLIASIYSNLNRFYFLEGMTSVFVYLIFYALRKEWDYKLRSIFLEKFKFQHFYNYMLEYVDGLNGYNISIMNEKNIFYGEKFSELISYLEERNFIYPDNEEISSEILPEKSPRNPLLTVKSLNNLNQEDKTTDSQMFSFLKNLKFHENYELELNNVFENKSMHPHLIESK